jgi:tetratricopeptide (TPR) repeat protein
VDNLEYIETYFNGELSPERKKEFEQRIVTDPVFAEEVAFYLSSKQVAAVEMRKEKEKFKEIYQQYKQDKPATRNQPTLLRKLLPWAAMAAGLAGIVFGLNVWLKPVSPQSLADKYILENFQTLSVKMNNKQDSLQAGLRLYNEGRTEEALKQFEEMAKNDTTFGEAKKYAGIVSLRLGQYDKAINYFLQVENFHQLHANPGKFYRALTLLKRNLAGDKKEAKKLLNEVVQHDLEGKEPAKEILDKW